METRLQMLFQDFSEMGELLKNALLNCYSISWRASGFGLWGSPRCSMPANHQETQGQVSKRPRTDCQRGPTSPAVFEYHQEALEPDICASYDSFNLKKFWYDWKYVNKDTLDNLEVHFTKPILLENFQEEDLPQMVGSWSL